MKSLLKRTNYTKLHLLYRKTNKLLYVSSYLVKATLLNSGSSYTGHHLSLAFILYIPSHTKEDDYDTQYRCPPSCFMAQHHFKSVELLHVTRVLGHISVLGTVVLINECIAA